jgi:hypothetical protein
LHNLTGPCSHPAATEADLEQVTLDDRLVTRAVALSGSRMDSLAMLLCPTVGKLSDLSVAAEPLESISLRVTQITNETC